MLTTDQRNEMRLCIVGPCSEAEKNTIRGLLVEIEEAVATRGNWHFDNKHDSVYFDADFDEWDTSYMSPTITAADFIKTYLQP